ncbi:MAG: energy-coupling factor transporter transmembrane component T family protein [Nitrososphaerales archaeon]
MQWVAAGFLFVRGNSIIHKLDPRMRLFLAADLFVVGLLSRSVTELILLILLSIGLAFLARIAKRFAKSMVFVGGLAAFAFLLGFFLSHLPLVLDIINGLRLFAVIEATSIFFLTTTPDELEQVMRWFHLPMDFVMVFVIAVRFVPVLLLDALQIMDAQRSRGLEFEKGNLIRRLKNTIPLLVPLIAVAVTRSLDLAEAMDARAYGALKKPSAMYILKLKASDYTSFALFVIGGAVGLYAALFVNLF